ncbi:MAG: hypothetical protein P8077_08225, partial [Gammaproteobacteria bacterium]
TDSSDNATSATVATLSGAVVANGEDVSALATRWETVQDWVAGLWPVQKAEAAQTTGALTNVVLPNATVSLYRIAGGDASAEAIDIGTVMTDASGAFSINDVPLAPEEAGQDSDYYYEIRVSKGDLTLTSPVAPRGDVTVNVSPETDLAAKILSDVREVPGDAAPPVPSAGVVESTRELVLQDAADLVDGGKISIPSANGSGNQNALLAAANGVAAAGGNAEKAFKVASLESEYYALAMQGADASSDEVSGYLTRLVSESCNQGGQYNFPQPIADAFTEAFKNGTTATVSSVIEAYNNHYMGTPLVADTVIAEFNSMLTNVSDNIGVSADRVTRISNDDLLGLMAKRSLSANRFGADTALSMDQVAVFIQVLGSNNCAFDSQLDLYGFIGELLGDTSFAQARVSGFQIYHNSGFGCDEGSGEGHFMADIGVYPGTKTVTSVVVTSTDTSALGGDGTETLSYSSGDNRYISNDSGVCVTLGMAVTYTITVNFNDGSTRTRAIVRNHPRIPEASSQVLVDGTFVTGSADSANPTVVSVARPLYQWTSPSEMKTAIIMDPANTAVSSSLASSHARVKYTYEFSHVDLTASTISPASECESVPSGRLYSVSSFIPTVDCDVNACAAALGIDASDVGCRINIQSYYVNRRDKILGQAAGHFRFFCVDTDSDGFCG